MEKIRILLSQLYIKAFGKMVWIFNDKEFNKILFYIRTGRKANLDNPRTFNENVLARKVFNDELGLNLYTDKYQVREYVTEKIGSEYVVPCFGIWDNAKDIDFSKLPKSFVLKATHGSGWNIVVTDKDTFDFNKNIKKMNKWLSYNYYYKSREKNYKNIKPRILCEKFIDVYSPKGLVDFKVYCFRGKGEFFEITYEENSCIHQTLYYPDFVPVGMKNKHKEAVIDQIIMKHKDHIFGLAESLADRFEFVRADFYIADDRIYFSELTFHSGGGIRPIEPNSVDYDMGKFFL